MESPSPATDPAAALLELIRLAHAGERAAALAYRGHARSVRDAGERARIAEIEAEEWHHREQLAKMLAESGAGPARWRELRAGVIGRALSVLCHLAGWFAPMYGAGRLERRNIIEYETAARLARACGRTEWIDCFLAMAEVEWEHERYFREKAASHPFTRRIGLWDPPPPKAAIRESFHAGG